MRSPGVREGMGRNGPRRCCGASGLRSKVSSWLGPPKRKRKITLFALPPRPAPASSAARTFGSESPRSPAPPACNTSRRESPSHVLRGRPKIESTFPPSGHHLRERGEGQSWIGSSMHITPRCLREWRPSKWPPESSPGPWFLLDGESAYRVDTPELT